MEALASSKVDLASGPSDRFAAAAQPAGVKSTVRALLVLEVLADGEARSLSELATTLGLPKSSLHSILRTMAAQDWLSVDDQKGYSLGVKALVTGQAYLLSDPVASAADRTLAALVETLDETVNLGQLVGPDIVYLAKAECSHPLRLVSAVGKRLPAHATALGKVLLAGLPDDVAMAQLTWPLPALTPSTIVSREKLASELAAIRNRGHAIDWGESTMGVRCFAVPVRTTQHARYALSCSVPEARLDEASPAAIVKALIEARDGLESRIAFANPHA